MKRIVFSFSLLLLVLSVMNFASMKGQNAATLPSPTHNWAQGNPLKIALLKWYPVNLITSFRAGRNPYGVAFDGANVWVANNGDATVTKLRASDGENLGTFSVGGAPMGVAFDGANIWVVNSFPNTVTKLRASDGKQLGEFAVGQVPNNAAFDGEAIWVTNSQGPSITKLRARDGKLLGTFPAQAPTAIIFDGTYIWVSEFNAVSRYKLDGTAAGTFTASGGFAYQIAFDGENIWVPASDGTLTELRASDGKTLAVYNGYGSGTTGIAFDGQNLWITASPAIEEVRRSDGKILVLRTVDVSTESLAFDGANIWAAGWGSNTAVKF